MSTILCSLKRMTQILLYCRECKLRMVAMALALSQEVMKDEKLLGGGGLGSS